MAVPPNSNWNTGPTQRLPQRPINPAPQRVPDRPRSRRATCGIVAVSLLIVVLVIGLGVGYWAWNKYQTTVERFTVQVPDRFDQNSRPVGNGPAPTPDIVKDPFNILLIGVDLRPGDTDARTDTIILAHIDPQNQWASLLSIPRDSCAEIPGYFENGDCWKINAAYTYGYRDASKQNLEPQLGGMALTRDTVEAYLDLSAYGQNIDYVAQVDFNGFKHIIDTIGGINIDVPRPLLDPRYPSDDGDYGLIRVYVPAGYQHMDGTTALRYARSRHADNDYGRSQRQQEVIRAIVKSLKERGLFEQIDTLNTLADELDGAFLTDLPLKDVGNMRALASLGSKLAGEDRIQGYPWPTRNDLGGADANTPRWDPADIDVVVRAWLRGPTVLQVTPQPTPDDSAGDTPVSSDVRIEVLNGASIRGLAGEVTSYLETQNYTLNVPGNAANGPYEETVIIDYGNHKAERNQLAALLGIKSRNIIAADDAPEQPADPTTDLVLLVGRDYKEAWRGR